MKSKRGILFIFCILGLMLIPFGVLAAAQSEATSDYTLTWWTVDGGGGELSADGYALTGTVGQPDAGELSSEGFEETGGFWSKIGEILEDALRIFLPLVKK